MRRRRWRRRTSDPRIAMWQAAERARQNYREAVRLTVAGEPLPISLNVILASTFRTVEQFQADVEAERQRQTAENLYWKLVWLTAAGYPSKCNREAVLRAAGRTLLEFDQDVAAERM